MCTIIKSIIFICVIILNIKYCKLQRNDLFVSSSHNYNGATPCEHNDDCSDLKNSTCVKNFCMCNGSRICEDTSTYSVVTKIGEVCGATNDCNIDNSECKKEKCQCKNGHVKSTNSKHCLIISEGIEGSCEDSVQCYTKTASSVCQDNKCVCQQHQHDYKGSCYRNAELGEDCVSDGECSYVPYSKCMGSKCTCMERYVAGMHQNASKCLMVAEQLGSLCLDDVQCKPTLDDGSECFKGACRCKELYRLKNSTRKCVRDMFLGDMCDSHEDCFEPLHEGEARLECLLGKCVCKSFYQEVSGYCVMNSGRSLASFGIAVITLYQIFFLSFTML